MRAFRQVMTVVVLVLVGRAAGAEPRVVDPVGTWRHGEGASWTITKTDEGLYFAQESGYGNASGPAHFMASGAFYLDYVTRDGAISGYYEMRFARDGQSASGSFRELTGPKRSGKSQWARVGASPTVDPVGTWRHGEGASWTITRAPDGRYFAQEAGYGNASGPAYFTAAGTFRIDYVTHDGTIAGFYDMRLAPDGQRANGSYREITGPQRSGPSHWTRIAAR